MCNMRVISIANPLNHPGIKSILGPRIDILENFSWNFHAARKCIGASLKCTYIDPEVSQPPVSIAWNYATDSGIGSIHHMERALPNSLMK